METIAKSGGLNFNFLNRLVTYYEECLGLSDIQRARNEVNQVWK
jgi:hypothetical protein